MLQNEIKRHVFIHFLTGISSLYQWEGESQPAIKLSHALFRATPLLNEDSVSLYYFDGNQLISEGIYQRVPVSTVGSEHHVIFSVATVYSRGHVLLLPRTIEFSERYCRHIRYAYVWEENIFVLLLVQFKWFISTKHCFKIRCTYTYVHLIYIDVHLLILMRCILYERCKNISFNDSKHLLSFHYH